MAGQDAETEVITKSVGRSDEDLLRVRLYGSTLHRQDRLEGNGYRRKRS